MNNFPMMKKLDYSMIKGYANKTNLVLPNENQNSSKEKVLQFGTGVLLRGLPDYFIDKANSEGRFNGRIVVVKSTGSGDTKIFDELLPLLTEKLAQINSDNFKEIWTDIMKESGLIRDNNIDELLKQINE